MHEVEDASSPAIPRLSHWQEVFVRLSQVKLWKTSSQINRQISIQDWEQAQSREVHIEIDSLVEHLHSQKSIKLERSTGLPKHQLVYLASLLSSKADLDNNGCISCQEWEKFVESKGHKVLENNKLAGGFLRLIAYSPTYSCSPPTVFIAAITVLQITFYLMSLFAPETLGIVRDFGARGWLLCSYFIYDPHKRSEVWRFVTYMLLHGDHQHITFNCIIQLFVGIPLEMSQPGLLGSLRVFALYMAGVLLGSLGASVIEPKKYLVGASAGVYALISAHLATLILNWKEDGNIYRTRLRKVRSIKAHNPDGVDKDTSQVAPMSLNPIIRGLRLFFVLAFTVFDIGYSLYSVYGLGVKESTSYAGHAFGALAGLLIGVFVLKNRRVEDWEVIFQSISFVIYGLLVCLLIAWHIVGTATDYFPDPLSDTDPLVLICNGTYER